MGLAGLSAAARSADGRGPKTALETAVPVHFGLETPMQVAEAIHLDGLDRQRIGELAPLVLGAAREDDVATGIAERLVSESIAFVRVTLERLDLTGEPADVVLGGGLFQNDGAWLADRIAERLGTVAPHASVTLVDSPPVVGAALLGLDELGAAAEREGPRPARAGGGRGPVAELRFEGATRVYPGSELPALDSLDLDIQDGELMVLVGPSGSGKTTALRMLAGLEDVDAGSIWIGDREVTYVPPKDRDVAMVFQNYALYPYLDVAANIAFPLKMARVPKAEREERVRRVAEMLELEDYLARKPSQLSGGQRQRVAMGRAVVREPKAFLMDEPLSNLDAKLRVQMRADIAALQQRLGVTTVYVTHDQVEAMTMGHRIAVLRDGRLQQWTRRARSTRAPPTCSWPASSARPSMNLLEAEARDGACELNGVRIELPGGAAAAAGARRTRDVGLRPDALELAADGLPARVEVVEDVGAEAYAICSADLAGGERRLIARVDARRSPGQGERVHLRPVAEEAHLFDPDTGDRL